MFSSIIKINTEWMWGRGEGEVSRIKVLSYKIPFSALYRPRCGQTSAA